MRGIRHARCHLFPFEFQEQIDREVSNAFRFLRDSKRSKAQETATPFLAEARVENRRATADELSFWELEQEADWELRVDQGEVRLKPDTTMKSRSSRTLTRLERERPGEKLRLLREPDLFVERASVCVAIGDEERRLLDAARRRRTARLFDHSLGQPLASA